MGVERSPGTRMTERKQPRQASVSDFVSTAALGGMTGYAQKGPVDVPTLITGPDEFAEVFGGRPTSGFPGSTALYDGVRLFFAQTGKAGRLYVHRVASADATKASRAVQTLGAPGSAVVPVGSFPASVGHATTFVIADTGSAHTGTVTFNGYTSKAVCTGGSYAAGAGGDSITVTINGVPGSQVIDLSTVASGIDNYVAAINAAISGAKAVKATANIEIITDRKGSGAGGAVTAVGGAAGTKLGISTSTPFNAGGSSNVVDLSAVTVDEFYTLLLAAFGSYASIVKGVDQVTVSSLGTGVGATLTVSGTAVAALPLCSAQTYTGSASASTTCLTLTAASVGAWGAGIKTKISKVDRVVAYCADLVTANSSVTRIPVTTTTRLIIGDQISITTGTGTVRGIIASIEGTSPPAIVLKAAVTVPNDGMNSSTPITLETFDIGVYNASGALVESFSRCCMSSDAGANYVVSKINTSGSNYITATIGTILSSGDPRPATDTVHVPMTGGSDGVAVGSSELIGSEAAITGVYAWNKVPNLDLVGIPQLSSFNLGATPTSNVLKALETYVDGRGDVFMVADGPDGLAPTLAGGQIVDWLTSSARLVTSQGAIWYPWLYVGQDDGTKTSCSPMGAVIGIIARTHSSANIGQAPAGETFGTVNGTLGCVFPLQEAQYDVIYPRGVNGIYDIENKGTFLWGNSTFDVDGSLATINSRLVTNKVKRFVKAVVREVTTFAPNDLITRSRLVTRLEDSFAKLQAARVLQGPEPKDGFRVTLDDATIGTRYVRGKVGIKPIDAIEFVDIEIYQLVSAG